MRMRTVAAETRRAPDSGTERRSLNACEGNNVMRVATGLMLLIGMFTVPVLRSETDGAHLQAFEARYSLERNGKRQGESLLRLRRSGEGRWELRMTIEANRGLAGLVGYREEEYSLLEEHAESWRVLEYRRERGTGFSRRNEQVRFDWSRGLAEVLHEERTLELAVEPGTVDPGSLALRIAADLAAGRVLESYAVVRKAEVERWPFRVLRREPLDGRETIVVERVREHQRRSTISWLGADIAYLPVRIEQSEDGDRIVMRLESFEWTAEAG